MSALLKNNWFVILFFSLFFLLGIFIFRDYGTTWDEPLAKHIGVVTYDYIAGNSSEMLFYPDRDYGPAFELLLVTVERGLRFSSPQHIIYLRHFLTFLLIFISSIFFYKLAYTRFNNRLFALLAPLFLILSPRIFADFFYNTKDMAPFGLMIIAVYTMVYFLIKPTFKRAVAHALACALLIDVRLPGLIIIILTVGFFLIDAFIVSKLRKEWVRNLKILGTYLGVFILLMILFWPFLWINPVGHFFEALINVSRFTRWDDTVNYFGKFIRVLNELPWHYSIVWISITTPLTYLALFLGGTILTFQRFIRHPLASYLKYRSDTIFLAWFFAPLILVIAFHSVIYDGWRHLYFIYPALILIALVGLNGGWQLITKLKKKIRLTVFGTIGILIIVNLISVLSFMILYHPYQNLYFNALAGGINNAKKNFELDYWGLTFKKGLEYIAKTDKSSEITVFFSHGHQSNIDVLPDADRKRFIPQDNPEGAKYILTNYRWHPEEYSEENEKVYGIYIDSTQIMSVYKFY